MGFRHFLILGGTPVPSRPPESAEVVAEGCADDLRATMDIDEARPLLRNAAKSLDRKGDRIRHHHVLMALSCLEDEKEARR